jgi:TLC domain
MTGSRAQWYNGMALLFTFFSCRLIWGTWQSITVDIDLWEAVKHAWSLQSPSHLDAVNANAMTFQPRDGILCANEACVRANAEVSRYFKYNKNGIPIWMIVANVIANLTLNMLNYYWFSQMIETVLKRFREPRVPAKKETVLDAAAKLDEKDYFGTDNQVEGENGSVVGGVMADKTVRRRKA